jgi:PAS domain-containing protein
MLCDDWELTSADRQLIEHDSWPLTRATRGDFVRELGLHYRSLRACRRWDCSVNVVPIRDADGDQTRIVQTLRDIAVQKAAERALIRQQHPLDQEGLIDKLTGIPDRCHVLALADHQLTRARGAAPLTIASVDIDHF